VKVITDSSVYPLFRHKCFHELHLLWPTCVPNLSCLGRLAVEL